MTDFFMNLFVASVLAGAPLLFGTLGEIITEKSGSLNLGVEGIMWVGSFVGFFTAFTLGNVLDPSGSFAWLGILLAFTSAFLAGCICSLLFAFLTVTLKANQNVTGLTLTTFGIGLSKVLGTAMSNTNGNPTISDSIMNGLKPINIPVLSNIPYVGKLLFQYNIIVYFAVTISIVFAIYYKRTKSGLNIRAIGENPAAADASGINVSKSKYIHIILGGGICSIGGAYMSLIIANGNWSSAHGIVNGYGWIAVALVIFSSWNPAKAIWGSFIFGAFSRLQYYIPAKVIQLPIPFYKMLPFILTTIVLIITSIRDKKENAQPAGVGINYFREER